MRVKFNTQMLLGGGVMALANHFADKQKLVLPEERKIGNSELLSAGVILGDLFLGERVRGAGAGILNGAVAGATYRLLDALLKGEFQAPPPATTSYPAYAAPAYYEPPAYNEPPVYNEPVYTEPAPAPVSTSVSSGTNILEI